MSKLETNTIDTLSGTSNLTIGSTNTSTITMPNGLLTGQNYPAFQAYLSASTTVSEATTTKVQFDTEDFDTDNCYDNATNYEFKPTVAGKYFVYAKMMFDTTATNMKNMIGRIYKNDVLYTYFNINFDASYGEGGEVVGNAIIDFNGSTDYIHASVFLDTANNADVTLIGTTRETIFGAFRIGA